MAVHIDHGSDGRDGVAMDRSSSYEYPPVPLPPGKSIRILHILPGRLKDELHLKLRTCEVCSESNYEALSYTWGARNRGRSVVLNGSYRLLVTDNLFCALTRLRCKSKDRLMWIDALCINQNDVHERSRQVAMMGDIYRCATRVCIWIGEPCERPATSRCVKDLLLNLDLIFRNNSSSLLTIARRIMKGEHRELDSAVGAVGSGTCWHERAWVIQEFFLARQTRILFGANRWTLEELRLIPLCISGSDYHITKVKIMSNRFFSDLYHDRKCNTPDLIQMASILYDAEATDPRDMIYSVLGLINPEEAGLIGVDYTLPLSKVCAKATYASLLWRNDFAILSGVSTFDDPARRGFASWAVDLSKREDLSPLVERRARRDESRVRSGEHAELRRPECDMESETLILSGVKCGVVMFTMRLDHAVLTKDGIDLICDAIRQAFADASGSTCIPMPHRAIQESEVTELHECSQLYGDSLPLAMYESIGVSIVQSDDFSQVVRDVSRCWKTFAQASMDSPRDAMNNVENEPGKIPCRFRSDMNKRYVPPTSCTLFVLDNGMVGLATDGVGKGDEIAACHVSNDNFSTRQELFSLVDSPSIKPSPILVLRPNGGSWKFRGLAWVHECMHKEFWDECDIGEEHRQTFRIT